MQINDIPVCVINLPERTERFARTQKELNKFFGCEKQIHHIAGVRHKRPMIGIAEAHMSAIQLAKDNNWEHVIIVEDDVHFQSLRSKQYADECFKQIPTDFDILLSGIYTGVPRNKCNQYWSRIEEFSALHFYIVHKNAYDKILAFNKNEHIDRWLGKPTTRNGAGLKCYVANEFFAIQYPGFSDNVKQEMNYDHLLKRYKLLK